MAKPGIDRLLTIMARLRDPVRGCPWDLEQDFASIAPHTIEEAYEVEDAIRRGAMDELRDELGDLLLQVVFHAQLASEAGHFAFADVASAICEKLIRRHPHVFGDAARQDAAAVTRRWEEIKEQERRAAGKPDAIASLPRALPALTRAAKLQRRAARMGHSVSIGDETSVDATALGDRLFRLVALANRDGIDPEGALRDASERFLRALAEEREP